MSSLIDRPDPHLITSRRNFLVRATAFTAAGAAVAVPIVAVEGLRERVIFQAKALENACKDYYAGLDVRLMGNEHTPEEVRELGYLPATWMVIVSVPKSESVAPDFLAERENLIRRVTGADRGGVS